MTLVLRKNNLCGRIRRARQMIDLDDDDVVDQRTAAALAERNQQDQAYQHIDAAHAAAAHAAAAAAVDGAGAGANASNMGFFSRLQQQDIPNPSSSSFGLGVGRGLGLGLGLGVGGSRSNPYLSDRSLLQAHAQAQAQPHLLRPLSNAGFFLTQNPAYAAQPTSMSAPFGSGSHASMSSHQQQHQHQHQPQPPHAGSTTAATAATNDTAHLSTTDTEQLLQELMRQQADLQAQINVQVRLNQSMASGGAAAAAGGQLPPSSSSSSSAYQQLQAQAQHQMSFGESDLPGMWQQINADVGNLDNSALYTGPTPGMASYLSGGTSDAFGRLGATGTSSASPYLLPPSGAPPASRQPPLPSGSYATGAMGGAPSSLFGSNAGWTANNLSGAAATAGAPGISRMAAQAYNSNANLLANLGYANAANSNYNANSDNADASNDANAGNGHL